MKPIRQGAKVLMARRAFLRSTGIALISMGVSGYPSQVSAHPLPETTLIFAPDGNRMSVTMSVPLAELALAMGDDLPDTMPEGPVSPELRRRLAAYLADHMTVTPDGQPNLYLRLNRAYLQRATHEHVGSYTLLVLDISAKSDGPILPSTLTFDAILHEVRNHRAAVFVQPVTGEALAVGTFRLDPNLGKAAPLIIPAPP